jgi:D-alanyl-D-alanine carboxypeptidase (penicillin-binding protein 5/6)
MKFSRKYFVLPVLLCLFALPAEAGYSKDSCPKERTEGRVRADMVFDLETGKIFTEKNAKASFHPASLTKLMSLALIFDDMQDKKIRPHDTVRLVSTGGQWDGRTSSIKSMTVEEAVEGIASASLNNALDGIAARHGTEAFVARMNARAREWGLDQTYFVNPTGWPTPQSVQMQRSTLYDMASLVRKIWYGYPKEIARYAGRKDVAIKGLDRPLNTTNNLLENATAPRAQPYTGVIGGKTGYTCTSGWHLIAVYEDPSLKRRMVAMSVGHPTGKGRDDTVRKLLDEARPKLIAFDRAEKKRIEQERKAAIKEEARRKADELKAKQLAAEAASRKVVVQTVTTTVTKQKAER